LLSLAATRTLRVPLIFTKLDEIGSFILLGTEGIAAS